MSKTLCLLMVCSLHLFSSPAMAQDVEAPESQAAAEDAVANAARSAREARDRGDYEDALKIIELAQVESPDDGLLIYERVLTLEAMGEEEIALTVIGENRDVLLRHTQVNDLAIVEQRLTDAVEKSTDATIGDGKADGQAKGKGDPVVTKTETAGSDTPWLGWTAVAVGAAGLTIGTILLVVAEADAVDLRCDDCSSGPAGRDITRQEFDDRKSSIRTRRIVGGVSLGIGTAALAYGLYEILTHEPAAAPDDSGVSFDVHRRGIGVTYTTTF